MLGTEPAARGDDAWLLGWGLGYASVGAASLLVPLYAIDLGAGALLVSLVAATAAFAGVPGAILWGRLVATTKRRRPFVLVALALTAAVLVTMPFYESPWTVLVANAALWFVVAAAAPVLNIIVVEGYETSAWSERFGLLNHYQGYGWLGGLVVGAVWSAVAGPVGFEPLRAKRLFFVAGGVAALAGLFVVYLWYPEKPTISERRFVRLAEQFTGNGMLGRSVRAVPFGPQRVYWALRDIRGGRGKLRSRFPRPLTRYLLAATVFFTGFAVFFGPLPAYLTEAGYSTDQVFGLFVASSAASAVSYTRVGSLAARLDPWRLQTGALLSRVVAFPLVAFVGVLAPPTGVVAAGVLFFAIGVTWAVISITATGLVTSLAPDSVRGEALGAYTALGSLGGGVGSILGGAVADGLGYGAAFGAAAVCVTAAVGLVVAGSSEGVPTDALASD
ncbi:Major Facilitator Superfamily protein [Halopelagius inordinatus]|uniref:Major Facilitator Superfamily protein n=1 Tax=Halopelagius inordinatus TaxID=553467 RepID=A0A1I2NWU2_9EURY|nr:MFS transporter [Halopelagius inordinatus]SFG07339.1 Major Facilitator Superfamily protein [Halopelagius inordinatus]